MQRQEAASKAVCLVIITVTASWEQSDRRLYSDLPQRDIPGSFYPELVFFCQLSELAYNSANSFRHLNTEMRRDRSSHVRHFIFRGRVLPWVAGEAAEEERVIF
jgi:hypothetical protein